MADVETVSYDGRKEMLNGIKSWLSWLEDDLRSIPFNRKITEFEDEIKTLSSKIDEFEDDYFSAEEAVDYKNRLDDLYNLFEAELSKELKDKNKLQEELKKIKNEINTLKVTIGSLKKKSWLKSCTVRLANWLKDPQNRKKLISGSKVVKNLLPGADIPDLPDE